MRLLKLFRTRSVKAAIHQHQRTAFFCEGNFGGTGSVTYSGGQASQGQGGFYVSLCLNVLFILNYF